MKILKISSKVAMNYTKHNATSLMLFLYLKV